MDIAKAIQSVSEIYPNRARFGKADPAYVCVVDSLPESITNFLVASGRNRSDLSVEASAGMGNWTANPWCGIFDKRITESASYGFYVAVLFSSDFRRVVLSIANSVTDTSNSLEPSDPAIASLRSKWHVGSLESQTLNPNRSSSGGKYEKATLISATFEIADVQAGVLEEKLGELLDIYTSIVNSRKAVVAKKYWALGAMWTDPNGRDIDKSAEFMEHGVWQNGFPADSSDSSLSRAKNISPGDMVALKSSFPSGTVSYLRIKAIGVVVKNHGDGINLTVNWIFKGPHFDIEGTAYRQTVTEIKSESLRHLIFDNGFKNSSVVKKETREMRSEINVPKNLILYGPPGVGKTYFIRQLQKSFEPKTDDFTESEILATWVEDLTWWEVIALSLLDIQAPISVPDLCEHSLMKIKISQSGATKINNIIWASLQGHTIADSKNVAVRDRTQPLIFDKSSDSKWFLSGSYKEILDDLQARRPDEKSAPLKRFEFVTFHQSYAYEDFVEGIRPVLAEDTQSLRYELQKGVFRRICERAKVDPTHDYAIFIDEINRANISRVFGELITLIELDKRIGATNEIKVTLPYSKSEFGVPPNLYIIGTMNSSDRSTAILDIALRRRFAFRSMMPQLELIPEKVGKVQLRSIVEQVNKRISALLGADYQIGHAYFSAEHCSSVADLFAIWQQQILPLLSEYFFDDARKLGVVAGPFIDAIELESHDDSSGASDYFSVRIVKNETEFEELMGKLTLHLAA